MKRNSASVRVIAALAAVALAAILDPAPAQAAQEQREVRRTFAAAAGTQVDLENLAGAVTIEGSSGGDIEVVATIHAETSGGVDAQRLLDLLIVEFDERGGRIDILADYPVGQYDTYRYPRRRGGYNTQTTYQRERVRVTNRDDDAVTLYVDFALRVPEGVSVDVENAVGEVTATDVAGDVRLDTGSGTVAARGITGTLEADTGSGSVEVEDVIGDVTADTGSGSVTVINARGDVVADTGSGSITLRDIEGRDIDADTGSGDITIERASGSIHADTGSGDIIGRDIVSGASISADTGSGDVSLAGDLSGARQIEIDTSSGDVDLDLTAYPGMSISIETGSGSISVDLPDLETIRSRRNYFRGTVGDASADLVIDTGSGSVRVRAR